MAPFQSCLNGVKESIDIFSVELNVSFFGGPNIFQYECFKKRKYYRIFFLTQLMITIHRKEHYHKLNCIMYMIHPISGLCNTYHISF